MTTTLLTPALRGTARQAGATLWRKQLLPVGKINYKGRVIDFTREYLAGLVKAFQDRAYDAVPLQFADQDNRHTERIEHRRGTVRDLELTDDGLDVIVAAEPEGAQYLARYPDIGISAKIVEDYERADGKFWPAAVKHVLATLDPRLTGMRPWQVVEAANEDGEVLDLTGEQFPADAEPAGRHRKPQDSTPPADPGAPATEENDMALTEAQEARLAKLLDLDDGKFDALLAAAEGEPPGGEELSDEELQQLLDSLPGDDDDTSGDDTSGEGESTGDNDSGEGTPAQREPAAAGAALSADAQAAIDLANARAEETALELSRVTKALAKAAFEKERDHYSREYGIPPRITDLARPVLEGEGHVVELANGSSIDAGAIVRKVLKEVGQTVRMLDLSGELGTSLDFSAEAEKAAEDQKQAERADLVNAFRKQTGL